MENESNAIWKHCQLTHQGIKAEFKMAVLRNYASCMERQVNEAVRITMFKGDMMLNSKSEWQEAPKVRVVPVQGLQEEQTVSLAGAAGGRGWARGRQGAGGGRGERGRGAMS